MTFDFIGIEIINQTNNLRTLVIVHDMNEYIYDQYRSMAGIQDNCHRDKRTRQKISNIKMKAVRAIKGLIQIYKRM